MTDTELREVVYSIKRGGLCSTQESFVLLNLAERYLAGEFIEKSALTKRMEGIGEIIQRMVSINIYEDKDEIVAELENEKEIATAIRNHILGEGK